MKTNITFLSLGPGDPELLTLKAVRMLREADIVMLPVTESGDGTVHSRAADFIAEWCSADKMRYYTLPMQQNREAVMHVYEDKTRRWASERRDAVFLRENGEELAIPMPVTKSFDEQQTLRPLTSAKPGTPMEITYYPNCKVVVLVKPV